MDYFYEFFSCYINNTVIVITATEHIKNNCTDIPALTPVCNLQVVVVLLTPLVVVKAKYTVGQVVFTAYLESVIKSDRSSLLFFYCFTQNHLYFRGTHHLIQVLCRVWVKISLFTVSKYCFILFVSGLRLTKCQPIRAFAAVHIWLTHTHHSPSFIAS